MKEKQPVPIRVRSLCHHKISLIAIVLNAMGPLFLYNSVFLIQGRHTNETPFSPFLFFFINIFFIFYIFFLSLFSFFLFFPLPPALKGVNKNAKGILMNGKRKTVEVIWGKSIEEKSIKATSVLKSSRTEVCAIDPHKGSRVNSTIAISILPLFLWVRMRVFFTCILLMDLYIFLYCSQ